MRRKSTKKTKIIAFSILIFVVVSAITIPAISKATTSYVPLTEGKAQGITDFKPFGEFVNQLYRYAIIISAMLAVIMISIGGFQYMGSTAYTSKETAKTTIQSAVIGLLIVLSAVLILETINPSILELSLFRGASEVEDSGDSTDSGVDYIYEAVRNDSECGEGCTPVSPSTPECIPLITMRKTSCCKCAE